MTERKGQRPVAKRTDLVVAGEEPVEVAVEGPVRDTYHFHGEDLEISDRIGLMPLLKFAHASSSGLDSADMEGLNAIYEMLRDCFTDKSWDRFQELAVEHRADEEELFDVVGKVIEKLTARPTGRPSDSSAGSPRTSSRSTGVSSSPDFERALQLQEGRPDLQIMTLEAEEHRQGRRLG